MDGGFDTIQILVVVLVVVAQGAGAVRAWYRKMKQRREQEEARLGLPGGRGVYSSTGPQDQDQPASAELPDWDPYEDEGGDEPDPNDSRRTDPEHQSGPTTGYPSNAPVAGPIAVPDPVAQVEHPASIPPHVAANAPSYRKRVDIKQIPTRFPGGVSLRNALLAKEILDRPLSARAPGGRAPRA